MRQLRRALLFFIVLIPLATLVHRNDVGRWDFQRSAMAGPDEFSYLLMADHFLHGGGLSLKASLGRDTFYPPGYPILLAGWARLLGGTLTAFKAHAFNACLLCVDTLVVYLFAKRVLAMVSGRGHRRFVVGAAPRQWLALLIAALFATNWHILECALFVMSEPAFMLAVFGWLALGLRWPSWRLSLWKTLAVAAAAITAWSIRGAGVACVATTLCYPILALLRDRFGRPRADHDAGERRMALNRRVTPIFLILMLAAGYQVLLGYAAPEKALGGGTVSGNSYPRQFLHGLTDGDRLALSHLGDYPALAVNLGKLVLGHFEDYASTFVPWPRENPDMHFRDIIGKIIGFFGLLGWLWHMVRLRRDSAGGPMRFLSVFIFFYGGLYLLWPFQFARFWSPIMPIMLVYAADAVVRFSRPRRLYPAWAAAAVLLSLLLMLSAEEMTLQMPTYARRLNYVSDALADGVSTIVRRSPDPDNTIIVAKEDNDAFLLMAWYLSQEPKAQGFHVSGGEQGSSDTARLLGAIKVANLNPDARVYLFTYFAEVEGAALLSQVKQLAPEHLELDAVEKVYQKEIVASIWEIRQKRPL